MDSRRIGRFSLPDQDIRYRSDPCVREKNVPPTQEDHRAQFFKDYRKEAEEYDKEFMKKHDEDLNTTLIFVSLARSSGGSVL